MKKSLKCSDKHPENCTPSHIKTQIISKTAQIIIISALVTSFALVFSTTLLDVITLLIGSENIILILLIALILLGVSIYLLLRVERKRKIWEDAANDRKVVF